MCTELRSAWRGQVGGAGAEQRRLLNMQSNAGQTVMSSNASDSLALTFKHSSCSHTPPSPGHPAALAHTLTLTPTLLQLTATI